MDEIEKSYFEKLYHSYIKLMFAHASHYVKNSVDIEDIVQESLVRILPKYSVLSSLNEKALATYIIYTVRSTAINHIKQEGIKRQWINYDDLSISAPGTEEMFFAALSTEELLTACKQISFDEQMILVLKYYYGFSVEELAKTYKCSLSNMRVRLFRARKKLKKLLSNYKEE